jgi:photosystem II stability/assembly factor-like uncharacterized protein
MLNWLSRRVVPTCGSRIGVSVLVLTLAFLGTAGSAQQDNYGFSINPHEVTDMFFLDSSQGWIVVADHDRSQFYMFETHNAGDTWTEWKVPDGIFRISFVSGSIGWCLRQVRGSHEGRERIYLLRTKTSGQAWKQVSLVPVSSQVQTAYSRTDLTFIDGSQGWFIGSSYSAPVLETSDGGKSVHRVDNLPGNPGNIYGLYAREDAGVWIYGQGFVWHSKNRGRTWTSPVNLKALGTNRDAFNVSDIFFSRDGRGWLAGQDPDGMILRTDDDGEHWERMRDDENVGNFSSIWFWDDRNGCATGYPAALTCTKDDGATWATRDVLPKAEGHQAKWFTKLVLLGSNRGWLLRSGGYLYHTTNGGETWEPFDPLSATTRKRLQTW